MNQRDKDKIMWEALNSKIRDLSLKVKIPFMSEFISEKIKGYGFEVFYDDTLIGKSPCHFKTLEAAHKAGVKWFSCYFTGVKE